MFQLCICVSAEEIYKDSDGNTYVSGELYINDSGTENPDSVLFDENQSVLYVSLRTALEGIGAEVVWVEESREVKVLYNDKEFLGYMDERHGPVDYTDTAIIFENVTYGQYIYLNDMSPGGSFEIINDRIYLAENTAVLFFEDMECAVELDKENKAVRINKIDRQELFEEGFGFELPQSVVYEKIECHNRNGYQSYVAKVFIDKKDLEYVKNSLSQNFQLIDNKEYVRDFYAPCLFLYEWWDLVEVNENAMIYKRDTENWVVIVNDDEDKVLLYMFYRNTEDKPTASSPDELITTYYNVEDFKKFFPWNNSSVTLEELNSQFPAEVIRKVSDSEYYVVYETYEGYKVFIYLDKKDGNELYISDVWCTSPEITKNKFEQLKLNNSTYEKDVIGIDSFPMLPIGIQGCVNLPTAETKHITYDGYEVTIYYYSGNSATKTMNINEVELEVTGIDEYIVSDVTFKKIDKESAYSFYCNLFKEDL